MNKFAPFYNESVQPKPVLMATISETRLLRLREIEEATHDLAGLYQCYCDGDMSRNDFEKCVKDFMAVIKP